MNPSEDYDDCKTCFVLEQDVSELEKYIEDIWSFLPIPVAYMTPLGIIIDINKGMEELLRNSRDELVGANLGFFFKDKNEAKMIVKIIRHDSKLQIFDSVIFDSEKEIKNVRIFVMPRLNIKGEIIGVFISFIDMTDQIIAQKQIIIERNNAKLYLDVLTHDINNQNQAIISLLELSKDYEDLNDVTQSDIGIALSQAWAISNLIKNVKMLSDLNQKPIILRDIEINSLIKYAIESVKNSNPEKNIKVELKGLDHLIFVQANDLINNVFQNILENAVKYSLGSHVRIQIKCSIAENDKFWKIEFIDFGKGVKDEIKSIIFNRLQRGEKGIKGSGLGLAIVRGILTQFGGKVLVKDRIDGDYSKGSNFIIYLMRGDSI